ncbi:serine hydrolase [Streptomyces sp. NBC_00347]|uniref:serine hydrolase domain-containing protein n=1 Tax=Streptomyces sp. NBC_00347 TaxID=2975721 RepID=UPI002251584D|nr:serine hydrolase domain-containing protein [Streptomyces sp. NBC_00347]MCX5129697.1 beta-lactamase family protein [Streptomyces sp. NBC_00347]
MRRTRTTRTTQTTTRTARTTRGRLAAAAATVLVVAMGLPSTPAAAHDSHEPLLAALRAEAGTAVGGDGIPGVIARTYKDGVSWTGAGATDAGTPVRNPDSPFRAASITKIFTATTVLQLVGEGRVSLDDDVFGLLGPVLKTNPVAGCNPGTGQCFNPPPGSPPITVRNLLQHSSGVFNYLGDLGVLASAGSSFPNLPDYSAQQLVDEGASHGPQFAPGAGMHYSNTNYVLLGMVIERVTGHPWADEVTRRVIQPLGLTRTVLPGSTATLPTPHDQFFTNYLRPRGVFGHLSRPAADWNPSLGGAAGAIVSTSGDLVTFIRALLGGQLLPPAQLAQMMTDLNPTGAGSPGSQLPGVPCDPARAWPECIVNPAISTVSSGDKATPGYWYASRPWKAVQADYGLGLTRRTITCQDGSTVVLYGHNGAGFGSLSYLYSTADGSHALVLNMNGDWPLWELYSLNGMLAAEFCTT